MDYKAFKKISAETEEAFAQHRFFDVLQLITAIDKDIQDKDFSSELTRLRLSYQELLNTQFGEIPLTKEKRTAALNQLYGNAITQFTHVCYQWRYEHQPTSMDKKTASLLREFEDTHIFRQLDVLRLYPEGAPLNKAFFEALDTAFELILCILDLKPQSFTALSRELCSINHFAQRTLVSALLMNVLHHFNLPYLELFLELAKQTNLKLDVLGSPEAMTDEDNEIPRKELLDLRARIAVGLTLIVRRYSVFLQYLPIQSQHIHDFMAKPSFRDELKELFRAIVNQSLTDRVDKHVDVIMPMIRDVLQKEQPFLGSSSDDDKDGSESNVSVEMHTIRIDGKEGRRLFRKMKEYAHGIEELRQNEMDVNARSMMFMKRFDFFNHPAHWLYPFTTEYPKLQDELNHTDILNRFIIDVMNNSYFCDSDRYSYLCMMFMLHDNNADSFIGHVKDNIRFLQNDEIDEFSSFEQPDVSALGSLDNDDLKSDSSDRQLPSYFNYCQCLYRLLTHANEQAYPGAFTLQDDTLLPCHPFFADLFTDYNQIEYVAETLLNLGAGREAIVLCNHASEHFGANVSLLQVRGLAYMNQQMWRAALSDLQQAQLFEDNPEIALSMARCYEAMHEWEDALPLLRQELQRQGDEATPDMIEEVARCHMQLRQWDEAASLFFRLEFMERHLILARRGIAWCSLHQGKFKRAEDYYRKLIEDKKYSSWEDHINLGHALWLQDQRTQALQAYRSFVKRFNRTKKDQRAHFSHWSEAFQEDAHNLLRPHFTTMDIALMLDAITMK